MYSLLELTYWSISSLNFCRKKKQKTKKKKKKKKKKWVPSFYKIAPNHVIDMTKNWTVFSAKCWFIKLRNPHFFYQIRFLTYGVIWVITLTHATFKNEGTVVCVVIDALNLSSSHRRGFEPSSGHMWDKPSSACRWSGGFSRGSPVFAHLTIYSAQNEWNNLNGPQNQKKKKKETQETLWSDWLYFDEYFLIHVIKDWNKFHFFS